MTQLADLVAPVPATHEPGVCVCRVCSDVSYTKLLSKAEYLRNELAATEKRLRETEQRLRVSEFNRLSAVIELAVSRNDRETWAAAVADRLGLGMGQEWLDTLRTAGCI
jgi:hypothetical protein